MSGSDELKLRAKADSLKESPVRRFRLFASRRLNPLSCLQIAWLDEAGKVLLRLEYRYFAPYDHKTGHQVNVIVPPARESRHESS